jgi:hypothetical protein
MPKFDRALLVRLFPTPRALTDFERLNKDVDEGLPTAIKAAGDAAAQAQKDAGQAGKDATQALEQIAELAVRLDGADLRPPSIPESPVDDLAPVSFDVGPVDDLAPIHFNP